MKSFPASGRSISRARARTAAALNLLAAPGLGSLIVRRWIAGTGQLVLTLIGFAIFMTWFVKLMTQYYGQMMNDTPVQPVGWIGEAGTIVTIVAWIWSALTSISVLREASANKLDALKNFAAPPPLKLTEAQIAVALNSVPDWKQNGDVIARTFQFKDFPAAIKFVNAVALAAEQAWHHPDIDIRWNKVTLVLTTHDAGGLTEKDFALARQFDELSLR